MKAHAIFRAIGKATREAGEQTGADKRKALGTRQVTGPRLTAGHCDASGLKLGTSRIGAEHRRDLK